MRIFLPSGRLGFVACGFAVAMVTAVGFLPLITIASSAAPPDGRELFTRQWTAQTPTAQRGDGLGPLFNARSCAECHRQGGVGGGGPNEHNVQLVNVAAAANVEFQHSDEFRAWQEANRVQAKSLTPEQWFPNARDGVMVLHRFGTFPQYEPWRLARLTKAAPEHPQALKLRPPEPIVAPRLRAARVEFVCGCFVGPVPSVAPQALEERNTPPLFGLGLLERVTLDDLERVMLAQSNAVRGRPALLADGRLGRFGWKAQAATLLEFNENACAVELGLTTPKFRQAAVPFFERRPDEPAPPRNVEPAIPDMTADEVTALSDFVAGLPRPIVEVADGRRGAHFAGRLLFKQIGCAECHTPDLGQVRNVYSDLLLHRVGTSGSGFYGRALPPEIVRQPERAPPAADEFRTPPLWGVADSAPYLHDGGAATLEEAIRMHGGQATNSQRGFDALVANDRRLLLAFLGSLRAPTTTVATAE